MSRIVSARALLRRGDVAVPPGVWVRVMPGIYRYAGMRVERWHGGWRAADVMQGAWKRFESATFKTRAEAFAHVERLEGHCNDLVPR